MDARAPGAEPPGTPVSDRWVASFRRGNSPCCPGWNCPAGRSSPRSSASSQQLLLLGSSFVGVVTSTCTMRSPRPPPRRCVTPRPCSGIHCRICAPWDGCRPPRDRQRAVQRHLGAERGRGHRNGHRAVHVPGAAGTWSAAARGSRRRGHRRDRHRARPRPRPRAGSRAVVDTGGILTVSVRRRDRTRPSPAHSGRESGPTVPSLALRTRPGGHDLPEEGPRDLGHLTPPATHVTGLG